LIAGIYRQWTAPDGRKMFTFAMLTVNADDHPLMKRFHKPGEEKRMVVILNPDEYLPWLTCVVAGAPSYCKQWHGALDAQPAPLPPRAPRAISGRVVEPPAPPEPDAPGPLLL
jgi:putative SOS response-associated peptidase YedK